MGINIINLSEICLALALITILLFIILFIFYTLHLAGLKKHF